MTTTSTRDLEEVVAQLEKKIADLSGERSERTRRRRSLRRPVAIASISVLTLGVLAGVAGASGSTTNVSFTLLTPSKVLLTNASIAAHKTNSPVVIGGTTTVPSDATTVELAVSAKGATSGTLDFYPADNVDAAGQTLTYPSGNAWVTTTIYENVGQSGEVTFYNAGTGTAVVSAKIVGYSTQVTAGDISPADGTTGQVLTNTGTGAQWSDPIGVQGYQEVVSPTYTVVAGGQSAGYARCPIDKVVVGGGVFGSDPNPGEEVNSSFPNGTKDWEVFIDNTSTASQTYEVYAVCLKG
jgi:hypothetical protein